MEAEAADVMVAMVAYVDEDATEAVGMVAECTGMLALEDAASSLRTAARVLD
jgi:hypothetical protein